MVKPAMEGWQAAAKKMRDELVGDERVRWAELPSDVLRIILRKTGQFEVLASTQEVCLSWRNLSLELLTGETDESWTGNLEIRPRSVPKLSDVGYVVANAMERAAGLRARKMAVALLDMRKGRIKELSMERIGDDRLLEYAAAANPGIRSLRILSCHRVTGAGVERAIARLPQLEELQVAFYPGDIGDKIVAIGRHCPLLRSLRLVHVGQQHPNESVAVAVARSMPMLRELQLRRNGLTDAGLRAILVGCPQLEALELQQCFGVRLGGDLKERCLGMKRLNVAGIFIR